MGARALLLCACASLLPLSAVADEARTGAEFFEAEVLPKLAANGCPLCHVPGPGYVRPAIDYRELLPYVAMGLARDDNVLLYKLANERSFAPDRPAHMGGPRCASVDVEPCASIQRWWQMEFGGPER